MMGRLTDWGACTVQLKGGAFCDAPSAPDAPFPICARHARQVAMFMATEVVAEMNAQFENPVAKANRQSRLAAREARKRMASVVYYVEIRPGIVKIGYTTDLASRIRALRLEPGAVLATESGGRALEKRRHQQFDHLRLSRREDFSAGADLLAHIAKVQAGAA